MEAGHSWGARLVLEELREGQVELWLHLPGPGFVGHERAVVHHREVARIDVALERTWSPEGRIVHADGSPAVGLVVRVESMSWPPDIVAAWGTVRTEATGHFRISATPARRSAAAVLAPDGSLLTRIALDADRSDVHTLR